MADNNETKLLREEIARLNKILEKQAELLNQKNSRDETAFPKTASKIESTSDAIRDTAGIADTAMAATVDKITGIFTAFFTQLSQQIDSVIQQSMKDLFSGFAATTKSVFDPREQIRDIAAQFGESGRPLSDQQLDELIEMSRRQAAGRRDAIFKANSRMNNVFTDVFDAFSESYNPWTNSGVWTNDFSLTKYRDANNKIFGNWDTQGK